MADLTFLSVTEAAAKLAVDSSTVRRWIRSGRLPAQRSSFGYLILARDLERMRRPRMGRPRTLTNRQDS